MAGVTALLTEITYRMGNRSDIAARTPIWLNDGYYELLLSPRFMFHELDGTTTITTVANTRAVSLATIPDLWVILSVRDAVQQRKLRRWDATEYDDLTQGTSTEQRPVRYARFGSTIELDPTPGSALDLTVRYRKRPAELVAGGSHLLGREWDEVLTVLAVVKGWEALEQTEKAGQQRQLLEGMLAVRESAHQAEEEDAQPTIGVAMEGWN